MKFIPFNRTHLFGFTPNRYTELNSIFDLLTMQRNYSHVYSMIEENTVVGIIFAHIQGTHCLMSGVFSEALTQFKFKVVRLMKAGLPLFLKAHKIKILNLGPVTVPEMKKWVALLGFIKYKNSYIMEG